MRVDEVKLETALQKTQEEKKSISINSSHNENFVSENCFDERQKMRDSRIQNRASRRSIMIQNAPDELKRDSIRNLFEHSQHTIYQYDSTKMWKLIDSNNYANMFRLALEKIPEIMKTYVEFEKKNLPDKDEPKIEASNSKKDNKKLGIFLIFKTK